MHNIRCKNENLAENSFTLTLLSSKADARLRQSLTPSKGALLKLLHTRLWTPT